MNTSGLRSSACVILLAALSTGWAVFEAVAAPQSAVAPQSAAAPQSAVAPQSVAAPQSAAPDQAQIFAVDVIPVHEPIRNVIPVYEPIRIRDAVIRDAVIRDAVIRTARSREALSVSEARDRRLSDEDEGERLYMEACATCHGANGAGAPQHVLGFNIPVPDFTDCDFASREPDADWVAVAHQGGPTRAFSMRMPAFGGVLSPDQLQLVMDHVRGFCTNDNWPRGELNLPRALITEKAFPEDEAVWTTTVNAEGPGGVENEVVYEQRFGARNQIEFVVPMNWAEVSDTGGERWSGGHLGDIAVGVKRAFWHSIDSGSIFSVTGEVIFPTGDEALGFGKGTTVFEPFASFGQILPRGAFIHAQSGVELPVLRDKAGEEAFWRGVLGKTVTQGAWGRAWSPMVEVLGARELESGAATEWTLVPQMQVTLNRRQHIMLNVGVTVPLDDPGRHSQVIVYVLWDWFDGGLWDGW